jgi:hypothetical protein
LPLEAEKVTRWLAAFDFPSNRASLRLSARATAKLWVFVPARRASETIGLIKFEENQAV